MDHVSLGSPVPAQSDPEQRDRGACGLLPCPSFIGVFTLLHFLRWTCAWTCAWRDIGLASLASARVYIWPFLSGRCAFLAPDQTLCVCACATSGASIKGRDGRMLSQAFVRWVVCVPRPCLNGELRFDFRHRHLWFLPEPAQPRPDRVWILRDDVGHGCLGPTGSYDIWTAPSCSEATA